MTAVSATKRRDVILERLRAGEECQVGVLAEEFNVSEMTVRRDLDALAAEGQIVRTHGGAAPASGVVFQFRFLERAADQRSGKEAIARRAAELVPDGATVILDSGSTTLAVARALRSREGLTIITSSLPVASELQYCESIEIILLGGRLRSNSPDLAGALTLRSLEHLHADVAVLGADAIDLEGACYHRSVDVAHLVGAMARTANKVYVVADASKIGDTATARTGSLTEWDGLVVDDALDAASARTLKERGVTLITATYGSRKSKGRG